MAMTENGISTTVISSEQYEFFTAYGKRRVQYDFRNADGKLFACVAKTLAEARAKRDKWLEQCEA